MNGRTNESDLTRNEQLQLAFWESLTGAIAARQDHALRTRSPTSSAHYKQYLRDGESRYDFVVDPDGRRLRCVLRLGDDQAGLFDHLEADGEEIEDRIGSELAWNPPEGGGTATIVLEREGDVSDTDRWEEFHRWFIRHGTLFDEVFGPRIAEYRRREDG